MAKNFIVTGANGVIGKEIVKGIASTGATVVLAVRRLSAGEETATAIAKELNIPKERLRVLEVDLSSQKSIKQFVENYKSEFKTLNGLVNNAAMNAHEGGKKSVDGIEQTWASNVMSYFLLSNLLLAAPSRIVNVASNYAGHLDLSDLQFTNRKFDVNAVYQQTKQANRMLSWALNDRINGSGVTVNACHPGVTTSRVLNTLGYSQGSDSPQQSAATPIFLATSPEVEGVSGKYFVRSKATPCSFNDKAKYDKLWEECSKLVKSDL